MRPQGLWRDQITPVETASRKGPTIFEVDEYVRLDAKGEDLAKLRPASRKEGGTVTVGNASGINDGAAAVVLAGGDAVCTGGLRPLARLVAYGHAGVDPTHTGMGPVPAIRIALERAGLTVADVDLVKSNESFAVQVCAVARELGLDPARTNSNGGAIALGYPVGATDAIIMTKLVHELPRTGGRQGLATMCIGEG